MVRTIFRSAGYFFSEKWDNFIRSWRNRSLSKGDWYQLNRWIDKKRFIKGTNLRDREVYEAGMRKEWSRIFDEWKLTPSQYEAVLISCRGHLPWAPLQYYSSHY